MQSVLAPQVKNFDAATREQIYALRGQVLREPQEDGSYPSLSDEYDDPNKHPETFLAATLDGDQVVATGRLHQRYASNEELLQARFMATREDYRNQGLGRSILNGLELLARHEIGERASIFLNARLRAVPFYRRAGYVALSEPDRHFPDEAPGVLHVEMYKELGYKPDPEIWTKIMTVTEALTRQGVADEHGVHFDWSTGKLGHRFHLEAATTKPGEEPLAAPYTLRITQIGARQPQSGYYTYGPEGIVAAVGPAIKYVRYNHTTETIMEEHERMLAEHLGTYGHYDPHILEPGDRGYEQEV